MASLARRSLNPRITELLRLRDTLSAPRLHRKARPTLRLDSGTQFPVEEPLENASQFEAEIWDTLSAKDCKRKAHHIPSIESERAWLSPLAHLGKRNQLGISPVRRGIPTSLRKAAF